MTGQWKPGDVAVITARGTNPTRRIYGEYPEGENGCWYEGHGGFVRAKNVTEVRPLVVIDPEDREQVERLRLLVDEWASQVPYTDMRKPLDLTDTEAMQCALREFANPTPPKPEEPTGLGAVVLAHAGRGNREHVVRGGDSAERRPWVDQVGDWHSWADLREVEIVSEGVTL